MQMSLFVSYPLLESHKIHPTFCVPQQHVLSPNKAMHLTGHHHSMQQ